MTITMARKTISALGVVYLLIGVLGFVPALVVATPVAGQGLLLGIFAVNTIHNLAHLVLGALMLYAGSSAARRSSTSWS